MNPALFLGIDGGATSCRARVQAADGTCLGEGCAESANVRFGVAASFAAVTAAARQALRAAGLGEDRIGDLYAGVGLAGIGQAKERAMVDAYPHPFARMAVETDAHIACLGAFEGGDGAVLVVGTGSCGLALVGGRARVIGGWGFPISDHGSGAWLGLTALRHALWAHDGAVAQTPLGAALMARFDNRPEACVAWMDHAISRDYAALAPVVFTFAAARDPLALALLREAGEEIALLVAALLRAGARAVCLMGGLAEPMKPWLPEDLLPQLVPPRGDALDGALLLARRAQQ